MHLFDRKNKSYFSSTADKLSLKKSEIVDGAVIEQEIEEFTPNVNLGTRDIAYELLSIDTIARNLRPTSITSLKVVNNSLKTLVDFGKRNPQTIFHKIKYNERLTAEELAKEVTVNKITMKSSENNTKGALTQIEECSTLASPINLQLTEDKIAQWRKNFKVYFSQDLTKGQKENIILSKLGEDKGIHYEGHKMTFMVESQFYLDSKDQVLHEPVAIKILGFCYPDFRLIQQKDKYDNPIVPSRFWATKFWGERIENGQYQYILKDEISKQELTEALRINLLAVIAEAQKVDKPLPFFINIPGAFLAGLSEGVKTRIKKLIAESINDLKKEYSSLIKENISEFIVLGSQQVWGEESIDEFKKDADYRTKTHIVNADMLDIVQKLRKDRGIVCPVPMMANPSHAVGCQYLESNFSQTAFDEMLARRTGGLHCAIFEGGVIKQIANAEGQSKDYLRSIDSDPVFKTFSKVQFDSCVVNGEKIFYSQGEMTKYDRVNEVFAYHHQTDHHQTDIISQQEKLSQDGLINHSFKLNNDSACKFSESIDVAPIFSTAVKNAVRGLEFLQNFETNDQDAQLLFHIMAFANEKQGVGNKIEDLKKYFDRIYKEIFKDNDQSQKQTRIDKIAQTAKTFSYRFQKEMKEKHGFETGRINAKNPDVGARLHRMASKENIMQFFANTKFAEELKKDKINLQENFEYAKELLRDLDSPTPPHSHSASPSASPSPRNSSELGQPAGERPPASLRESSRGGLSGLGRVFARAASTFLGGFPR